jgi:hypothetical protein
MGVLDRGSIGGARGVVEVGIWIWDRVRAA